MTLRHTAESLTLEKNRIMIINAPEAIKERDPVAIGVNTIAFSWASVNTIVTNVECLYVPGCFLVF